MPQASPRHCHNSHRAVATTFTFIHNNHPTNSPSLTTTLPHLSPCCCQYCTITVLLLQYNACHVDATNLAMVLPCRCHNSLGYVAIIVIILLSPQPSVCSCPVPHNMMLHQSQPTGVFSSYLCCFRKALLPHTSPYYCHILLPQYFLCCCRITHIAVAMNYSNILKGLRPFFRGPIALPACLFTANS